MRRVASHYIWFRQLYRMHYIELDDHNRLTGIYPLCEEIAGTEFYDGLLIPVPMSEAASFPEQIVNLRQQETDWPAQSELFAWLTDSGIWRRVEAGDAAALFLLNRKALASSEFSTDNSRGNSNIQRL